MKRKATVILANGEFPKRGGAAWRLLSAATRVVCCDGAADAYRRRFRKWPDVIIGDLDSVRIEKLKSGISNLKSGRVPEIVRIPDQDTNDLEKAMAYCAMRGWKHPVIVGATGKREDHTLGNVFRALAYGCEMVTDCGRFVPVCGRASFKVLKGAAVSIFATDPRTRMTSKGLEWPLDGVKFKNLYCATLNRATATRVTLTSTHSVSVFIADRQSRHR